MAKRSRGLPDGFTRGLSEEFKSSVRENRWMPILKRVCRPYLPTEDIAPETLRPGHLDEVTALAQGCLETVSHVRSDVGRLHGHDDDRWWLQGSLLTAMNTGVRTMRFLAAGLRNEIVLTYPSSTGLTAAGITRNNAHDLAAAIALDLVCRAWSPLYLAVGLKLTISWLLSCGHSEVRMDAKGHGALPVFSFERLPDVAEAVRSYPSFDADEIRGKIIWENLRAKERRASQRGNGERQGPWSSPDTPKRWAKRFRVSVDTMKRLLKAGTIRNKRLSDRSYQVHVDDVPKA